MDKTCFKMQMGRRRKQRPHQYVQLTDESRSKQNVRQSYLHVQQRGIVFYRVERHRSGILGF